MSAWQRTSITDCGNSWREIFCQFFGQKLNGEPELAVKPDRPIPPPEPAQAGPCKYKRPPKEEFADYLPRYLQKNRAHISSSSLIDSV